MVGSRIIRDKVTRVGKGTGLLQFADDASVENALKMDGEKWKDHVIHVQRSKFAVHCIVYSDHVYGMDSQKPKWNYNLFVHYRNRKLAFDYKKDERVLNL